MTILIVISATSLYFLSVIERKTAMLAAAKSSTAGFELKRQTLLRERAYLYEIQEDVGKINNAFVDSENPIAFIEKLERFAKAKNIRLKLSPPGLRFGTLIMPVDVNGKFSDALAFLKSLEGFLEQGIVEELSLEVLVDLTNNKTVKGVGETQVRSVGKIEFLSK